MRQHYKDLTREDASRLATQVFLAVLAIPDLAPADKGVAPITSTTASV